MGLFQPHARHHVGVVEGELSSLIRGPATGRRVRNENHKNVDLDLSGKRVLIREDLNVPLKDGAVTSDARIRAALPTIQAALAAKAHVLVMSHLGRPEEGKFAEEFSLAPVARRLTQLLGVPVALKRDWLDGVTVAAGEVVLLENVRFNKGEKKDSERAGEEDGGVVRHLCHGRIRHGASRRGEHARSGEVRQGGVRGPAAGERAVGAGNARWKSRRDPCWPSSAARRCPPS